VGTETLICGTDGVEVRVSVAVSVSVGVWVGVTVSVIVGVNVGGSGEKVSDGSGFVGDRISNKAVWVNPATTVSAAAVLTAPGSCKVMAGIAQARITIDKVMVASEIRMEFDIAPPE